MANFWFCSASILNLCLVSWDRYVAVTSSLHYKMRMSDTRVRNMIVISWTLSFSVAIVLIAGVHLNTESKTNCTIRSLNQVFTTVGAFLEFILPVLFLGFVNGRVWLVARRHKKRIHVNVQESHRFGMSSREQQLQIVDGATHHSASGRGGRTLTRTIKQEIKTFKTFLIVIGVFVICWSPFYASMIADIFQPLNSSVFYLTIVLSYCNSALNVFIYGTFSREFRKAIISSVRWPKLNTV
jgi:hypothetical protein